MKKETSSRSGLLATRQHGIVLRAWLTLWALPCLALTTVAEAADRPNVLLILADDIGAEAVQGYNPLGTPTPHLDALAARGVRFSHAFSQPLCTPTRVKIMTGKYNFRNYDSFGYLSPEEVTFGDVLADAGYRTMVAGKWQLSGQGAKFPARNDPVDWGFQRSVLWQLNFRNGHGNKGSRYWQPKLERQVRRIETSEEDYGPDLFTDAIVDFVTERSDAPWFVYYPMALTHDPFVPPPGFGTIDDKHHTRHFTEMVTHMDKIVGRLTAALRESGQIDNTLFIFMGDNGTHRSITTPTPVGDYPGGKGNANDAGTWVPCYLSWPKHFATGRVDDRLVDLSDWFPTLLSACGVAIPDALALDGFALLTAEGQLLPVQREWVYCYYQRRQGRTVAPTDAIFVRSRRHRLYHDGRFVELPENLLRGVSGEKELAAGDAPDVHDRLKAVLDRFAAQGARLRTE